MAPPQKETFRAATRTGAQESPRTSFRVDVSNAVALDEGLEIAGDLIAPANQFALERTLERLSAGTLTPELDPITPGETLGVGHSMGSALTVVGDHDLHNTEGLREELPLCPHFSAMTFEDTWHCHFVSNRRALLWDCVGDWVEDQFQL